MSEKTKEKASKVEKRSKKDKKDKKEKRIKDGKQDRAAKAAFSLLADDKAVNPILSSLFAAAPTPLQRPELLTEPESQDEPDAELSEIDDEIDEHDSEVGAVSPDIGGAAKQAQAELEASIPAEDAPGKQKRKRKDADDDLEGAYLRKLEKEEAKEAKEATAERAAKRQKPIVAELVKNDEASEEDSASDDGGVKVDIEPESADEVADDDSGAFTPPPKHETQEAFSHEATKANRTVFLGNVSTTAITSKSARKTLIAHLISFFPKSDKAKEKDSTPKPKLESIRFRSTPYSTTVPKKAAYAKKELMDATTKSTNAYAVYSTPGLARSAARALNASVVLDRHLRVDEVAHPAKVDHKRCVFIGNLGFVDDESNIQAANAEEGREHRKAAKQPADAEEGLWRTMGRHGKVECVRVIRDSATRVSKGIAYVQFEDENGVEAALLDNEKKFPPLLPRKLRVSRAKAQKRNAKPGSGRPGAGSASGAGAKTAASGYKRKISAEEASQMGRTGKLYGKAAAAQTVRAGRFAPEAGNANANREPVGARGSQRSTEGLLKPEAFVFEGHRATRKQGTQGLKLGGKAKGGPLGKKKGGKPTTRSAKRGAAYKAGGKKGA